MILGGIVLLLALVVGDYWLYPSLRIGGQSHNQGRNGLWIRYTWYFGETQEFDKLAHRLKEGHIRYAYFHVRFINRDGSLHFRKPESAKKLNAAIETLCPDVQRIAWIYIGNRNADGNVDLSKPEVRRNMIAEAKWLIDECGFQGIQWDYEICQDGDRNFLALLKESRAALPGIFTSVAVPTMQPWPVSGLGWSSHYAKSVAQDIDQIAIMGYDTGHYFPRLYAGHLQANVVKFSEAAGPNCKVIAGIPSYGPGLRSHNPRAENILQAIKALREMDWPSNAEGLAIFADYTTDESEWATYEKYWLRSK
jgi:spore germination protein YaaH